MEVVEAGQLWRQYILAGFASIGILCAAYTLGWSAPTLLILEDVTISPLDHAPTKEQMSWIGSLFPVGAIFGSYLVSYTVSTIGRKRSLICSCLPMLIGWLLILLTSDITMIYAGRFLWGWAGGMFFTITPIYCAEIATDDCRGSLGTFLQMFCSIGFLLVYCIGPFTTYTVDAYVGGTIGLFYCIGLFFIPESPFFFLAKNDKEAASECLAKIRGRSRKTVTLEIDKMYVEVTASMGRTAKLADLCRGTNFKAIYISIALLVFQQFCGVNSSLVYLNSIFEAAGASLDPSTSSIIIGGILVFASCVTPLVADKIGRRTLLLFSSTGTAIGLGLLGLYFILADNNSPVVAHLGFLPIFALVMSILAYCAGLGPLPWAIMSEYLPIEVKSIVSPLATGMAWFLTFLTTRFFASVSDAIGMGGSFMGFAVICLCSTFFVVFLVPETKGKSFQEIQDILAGNSGAAGLRRPHTSLSSQMVVTPTTNHHAGLITSCSSARGPPNTQTKPREVGFAEIHFIH